MVRRPRQSVANKADLFPLEQLEQHEWNALQLVVANTKNATERRVEGKHAYGDGILEPFVSEPYKSFQIASDPAEPLRACESDDDDRKRHTELETALCVGGEELLLDDIFNLFESQHIAVRHLDKSMLCRETVTASQGGAVPVHRDAVFVGTEAGPTSPMRGFVLPNAATTDPTPTSPASVVSTHSREAATEKGVQLQQFDAWSDTERRIATTT